MGKEASAKKLVIYTYIKLRSSVVLSLSPHLPISLSPRRLGLLSLNATRY